MKFINEIKGNIASRNYPLIIGLAQISSEVNENILKDITKSLSSIGGSNVTISAPTNNGNTLTITKIGEIDIITVKKTNDPNYLTLYNFLKQLQNSGYVYNQSGVKYYQHTLPSVITITNTETTPSTTETTTQSSTQISNLQAKSSDNIGQAARDFFNKTLDTSLTGMGFKPTTTQTTSAELAEQIKKIKRLL